MMSMQGDQAPGGAVTSDASGSWGCGAYSGSLWFQLQWNDNLLNKSIAVKEMVPIIIAAAIWGRSWKGKLIICHCDNQSVVAVINSRYSRDDELMHLLRNLFFFEAIFEFHMQARHIPEVHNRLADVLLRDKLSSFLPKAFAMEQSPQGLSLGIIKVYLSALRHYQISMGMPSPHNASIPKLQAVQVGVAKAHAFGKGHRPGILKTLDPGPKDPRTRGLGTQRPRSLRGVAL